MTRSCPTRDWDKVREPGRLGMNVKTDLDPILWFSAVQIERFAKRTDLGPKSVVYGTEVGCVKAPQNWTSWVLNWREVFEHCA